jgi:hypothetical protein
MESMEHQELQVHKVQQELMEHQEHQLQLLHFK